MLRRDSPTPREHMSERLWMRDRMTLLHSVCHHHEFVKTSHRGSHETCSPQVLTEPKKTTAPVGETTEPVGETTTPVSAPDPFDPAALRLGQDFAATVGVKKLLTRVPVRKSNRHEFVRVHTDPERHLATMILELKEEREVYLVAPDMY